MTTIPPTRSLAERLLSPVVLFLLILVLHGLYVAKTGVVEANDTRVYSMWADTLIHSHFDYSSLGPLRFAMFTRYVFITVVALVKVAGGPVWRAVFLGLNVVSDALVGAMLVSLARRLTDSRLAALLCLGAYLLSFETLNWLRYVLSDTTFVLITFAAMYLIFDLHLDPDDGKAAGRRWVWPVLLVVISIFYRPNGVLFLIPLFTGWLLWVRARRVPQRAESFLPVIAFAVLTQIVGALMLWRPSLWPFEGLSRPIGAFARQARLGLVIFDRPETYHATPSSLFDFLWLVLDRFLHFFYFTTPAFSAYHNVFNILFFVPLYALMLAGLTSGVRNARPDRRRVLLLAFNCVLLIAVFHSVTQVDFDWRYRVPAFPYFLLLAAQGAEAVRRWVMGLARRSAVPAAAAVRP